MLNDQARSLLRDFAPVPKASPSGLGGLEARAAPRKLVNGRVKLTTDSGASAQGRLLDMSVGGCSLLLPDGVQIGILCMLACEALNGGVTRRVSAMGKVVNSVLVAGKGFRIGFQFQRVADADAAVIRDLLR